MIECSKTHTRWNGPHTSKPAERVSAFLRNSKLLTAGESVAPHRSQGRANRWALPCRTHDRLRGGCHDRPHGEWTHEAGRQALW